MSSSPKVLEILVVDDDHVVALLHKSQLKTLNRELFICGNGQEALDLLRERSISEKKFLVLLDLNMPVMNGWRFLEELRKSSFHQKVHVVIVTSSVVQEDFNKALEYDQVIGFCRKPLSSEAINEIRSLKEISHFIAPALPAPKDELHF